ncbi:diacylglycerol kinase family protein [Candidatus Sumerlaeota bacterium]|nr:diacylglycerol kinase family protein [Candidatus Sumerlaeota bacterium]
MNRPFLFTGRIRSFKFACQGIWIMLKTQHNAWIHACATVLVIIAGFSFRISSQDWRWIVLAIIIEKEKYCYALW